jgi:hypothetical protein
MFMFVALCCSSALIIVHLIRSDKLRQYLNLRIITITIDECQCSALSLSLSAILSIRMLRVLQFASSLS